MVRYCKRVNFDDVFYFDLVDDFDFIAKSFIYQTLYMYRLNYTILMTTIF